MIFIKLKYYLIIYNNLNIIIKINKIIKIDNLSIEINKNKKTKINN